MFQNLEKFSLPKIEKKVLDFWKANNTFEKAEDKNKGKRKFVFYEGPPTANGKPGIHHILSRSFKDIILRYKTMRGFQVLRRGGWDTHGLPVEIEVEKELGLKSKKDIEKYGIAEFNKKCKESVWKYKDEWEEFTRRIGFWLRMDNPYITYENSYIETLWWTMSEIAKKKLLYKAHKVVPWCSRCGTVVSSHELALGYRQVKELSVYVKFKLKPRQKVGSQMSNNKTFILSWTTTPWTLPGNVALAVGKNIGYVETEVNGERLIYAKDSPFAKELGSAGREIKGSNLVGLKYEPLFNVASLKSEKSYKIYPADFVTTDEGTGVVHTAVMYGEDDYELGKKVGLPQHHTVDENGKFTKDVLGGLAGRYVKDAKTEEKVINHLKTKNSLFKTELYSHDYPFCWRCGSQILYYARDSWFIAVSKLKKKLIETNEKINWIPAHIKKGRFGEWLKELKDWAISRERYWGTPLPVWECSGCSNKKIVGSFKELSDLSGGSRNKYILLRHGEAESNKNNIINSSVKNKNLYPLTLKGKVEAEKAAGKLKKVGVDLIFASDFIRTKETAEIVGNTLDLKVNLDKRLREINTGTFDGGRPEKYRSYFVNIAEKFTKTPPKGENLRDVTRRMWEFLSEMEKKHENKTILIVTHENPVWMAETLMRGWGEEEAVLRKGQVPDFIGTAEIREVELMNLPRNEWGIADPHRPYVDEIAFPCGMCGKEMKRVKEVMDVWFDSGAMPFAQAHYPFEHPKPKVKHPTSLDFPADYIVEGLDQTRGWFYTLHAVSNLLGFGESYKNVISHGLVLDKNGQKMSKSKGNTVDPWKVMEEFGVDSVRWYFYTVNQPGEPKRFDEKDIGKVLRNFVFLIYNSFVFFNTYAQKVNIGKQEAATKNVLDKWVLIRLYETAESVRKNLDDYNIGSAAREIGGFVDDLSKWYIRRSRSRFQNPKSKNDFVDASRTLALVLLNLSKIMSPFVPFVSEALYQSLKDKISGYDFKNSVHLEDWPVLSKKQESKKTRKQIIEDMKEVRRLASLALAEREEKGIKIRQPLAELRIKGNELKGKKKFLEVLGDEANVKQVVFNPDLRRDLALDSRLTHELKEEGWLREIIRIVQRMRRDAGLDPGDKIKLGISGDKEILVLATKYEKELKSRVGAEKIDKKLLRQFDASASGKIDDHSFEIKLRKA